MKDSDRLLARMRDELGLDLPVDARIERTRCGRHQLAAGAFSWFVRSEERPEWRNTGGCERVKALVIAKKLAVDSCHGDREIVEADEGGGEA